MTRRVGFAPMSARFHPVTSFRIFVLFGLVLASRSDAQTASPWTVDFSSERAAVTTGVAPSTWSTNRIQAMWSRPDQGGWSITAERDTRYGLEDISLSSRAYKRDGDWTFAGGGGVTPDANFLFRASADAEVSRRVMSTLVASAGYRFMSFSSATIHQAQPALTWYHARGEIEARVFLTRNIQRDRTTAAVLVRNTYGFSPRVQLTAGASFGDRIFDVAALPTGTAESRVGFANVRVGLTAHDFIDVGGTAAHERPAFTYRSFTVGYRKAF